MLSISKKEKMIKYKNINYVTLIAMFMIINIHFFNEFAVNVNDNMQGIVVFLRGFALPAVTLYLTNTAFTSFYLKKGVNYRSLFLYIIIPTLVFAQIQHYLFKLPPAVYNFAEGFNYSWFGEMYVYMMLLVPLALYLDNKSKFSRNAVFAYSIIFTILGYLISLYTNNSTINTIDLAMMFPYLGLTFFMYRIIEWFMKHLETIENSRKIKISLIIIIIVAGIFEMLAYGGILTHGTISKSYFSPFTIAFALSVWLLVYSLDLSKLPAVRGITKSSYFLFFTHWIIIRGYEYYAPDFVVNHVWIAYLSVVIGAYISAVILFNAYDFLVVKVLRS